ncbi:MAG: phage portal protein [Acidaminococcaceae bacterium]|nr:phage portal protein [Acidaminococcaceae bacterium]
MGIRDFFRNRVNRMAEGMDVFKKDVFELEGVPAFREYYTLFIFVWQAIYKGFYRAWHEVNMKTIRDPKGKKRMLATMNAGKMACSQMARYVWNERCSITASMEGNDQDDDPLNAFLQDVLKNNRFGTAFGDLLEKSFALGGGALREWVEIPKDENGNDIGEGKVRIGYTMASQFVPTAWDNSKVTSGIFISREAKDGFYYTTVEWHRLIGTVYRVTNDLYRMPIKDAEPQNILGWWYPLNEIYPLLSPDTTIYDVHDAFFQYIRPFGANYADDNSPLGMSIYAPALNTLHGLDIMFDSLQREFVLGKKRIIAPARAMKVSAGVNAGRPDRYFDADDEVWEALATDNPEDLKVYDNSVDLRVEPHISGINADLSILCSQIGFDPGTLSFDATKGLKTATEVISENSKTFGTVKAHENIIRDSLKEMVDAIFDLAVRYGLTWEGKTIESLIANGYNVSVTFDDSIIQDKAAEVNQGVALVGAGLMSKKKFMMETLGYTPEVADAELAQISEEGKANTTNVMSLFGGMT